MHLSELGNQIKIKSKIWKENEILKNLYSILRLSYLKKLVFFKTHMV